MPCEQCCPNGHFQGIGFFLEDRLNRYVNEQGGEPGVCYCCCVPFVVIAHIFDALMCCWGLLCTGKGIDPEPLQGGIRHTRVYPSSTASSSISVNLFPERSESSVRPRDLQAEALEHARSSHHLSTFTQRDDTNINQLMRSSNSEHRRIGEAHFHEQANAGFALADASSRITVFGTSDYLEKEKSKAEVELCHAQWKAERDAKAAKRSAKLN